MKIQACSVLLPLYNGANFIDKSLTSVLASMREIDELVLVNDGSEDISAGNLKKLEQRDSRIRVINKSHSGLVDTLNYGINLCENELIARADIDDSYSPDRISKQIEFLFQNPNCAAVFSDYQIKSVQGENLGMIPTAISPMLTKFSLLNPQRTAHPSVLFRKSAIQDVGLYKSNDFPAEDLSLWLDLSRTHEIATIPQTLLHYTIHKGNITNRFKSPMINKTESLLKAFIKSISIEAILNDAEKTFGIYDHATVPNARKILFFRDLAKHQRTENGKNFGIVLQHISLFSQIIKPISISTFHQLKNEQRLRKNF
jgi:glycosyltransferase involved in cell wall biosynthesis